ncbi:MAG TPA: serine hydrolase domain-containing protein, partial [Gammaproteobacteria bacterium]|nr:serine hydrolase domain-containing protein [Gammaproteobacteria bacterium]
MKHRASGLRWHGGIPLAWQPDTRWQYGVSTDVLGILLERLTGQRLDRLLDEMLFTPLAMKDTGFQVKPEQQARLADALDADPLKARGWRVSRVEADPGKRYRL